MTKTADPRAQAELAARLRLAVMRLARRLRQQAPEGISPSQLSVLSTLELAGSSTLGALADAERVKPPTMTRIVASLEEAGLVERETDPQDRRIVQIALTSSGKRLIARSRTRKNAYLAARLDPIDPKELAVLEAAVPLLEGFLEDPR